MTTIMPEGNNLKKAITWIDESRAEKTGKTLLQLIDEAGMRFNLTPKDSDFLVRFYIDKH
ncbi:MAG: hypothetical protein WC799_03615 [Desulfobacteraceae bacterium]|jgi:hypothetical protein